MNEKKVLFKMLEKFDFYIPISTKIRKKIYRSKKQVHKRIASEFEELRINDNIFIRLKNNINTFIKVVNFKTTAAASFAAACLAAGIIIIMNYYIAVEPPALNGITTHSTGDVLIRYPGISSGKAAFLDTVPESAEIKTGVNSRLLIQMNKIGTLFVLSNSEIKIKSISVDGITSVFLKKGRIFSRVLPVDNGTVRKYIIETHVNSIEVAGTEFLTFHDEAVTEIALVRGELSVSINDKDMQAILLDENKILSISSAGDIKIVPMGRLRLREFRTLSIYPYIEDIENKSNKEIKEYFSKAQYRGKQIEKKIEILHKHMYEWETISPIEKLRRLGLRIDYFHLKDGTIIGGNVVIQDMNSIKVETGEGVIEIPKNEIVRRVIEE